VTGREARLPRFDRRRGERGRDIPAQRFEPRVRTLVSRNKHCSMRLSGMHQTCRERAGLDERWSSPVSRVGS
jgi:Lon protease-like protein